MCLRHFCKKLYNIEQYLLQKFIFVENLGNLSCSPVLQKECDRKIIMKGKNMLSSISNSYNRPSFGMAYVKPGKEVTEYLRRTISDTPKSDRADLVNVIKNCITAQKNNPVPIELVTRKPGDPSYIKAIVNGTCIIDRHGAGFHKESDILISTLRDANHNASEINNVNNHVSDIIKTFD
jgi:hypothetical protein